MSLPRLVLAPVLAVMLAAAPTAAAPAVAAPTAVDRSAARLATVEDVTSVVVDPALYAELSASGIAVTAVGKATLVSMSDTPSRSSCRSLRRLRPRSSTGAACASRPARRP